MNTLYKLPGLLLAIVIHELAHGYSAYLLGDNTAKNQGRLSLNPLKHIDPVGFLSLLIFKFGWAKPVPINPFYFKNRKGGTLIVSLAGPLANFILAFIISLILKFNLVKSYIVAQILLIALLYNIGLGVFNLLPFPPLDGSKIVASLLPRKLEYYFYKYERYFYIILVLLIFSNAIGRIINPIINMVLGIYMQIIFS
ncbi:MAG: site-2 protease family protein [Tissierellia bacterium]|nr:site-2 protease family protein [Tissierellia bacterium]